ncbi:hypothetical protein FHL15_003971 [Xylaria flabelliformis]|uniref:Uncharacterized protein n=1 Tax=Xylaria flabelliformis TaxID=2512241 RepID=A0A553I4Z7_9PEZI|nr:hypothetical protein FHL15_003971 [Xylaria flabelliformis]
MSTTSYSSSGSRPTSRQYNTGFPDSFASCTTSMRHPDAISDPTFAISAEHIDPAKTLHRSRKSMLRKHRRTISHGKITEGSFGQDYMERPASAGNNATAVEQKAQGVNAGIANSSGAGAETPSRVNDSKDILGFSPGFRHIESREHGRGNIFNKMMNKS